MFTLNSRDLRILHDMGFNDFIKDDFIPEDDGQVTSDSASLPDPVVLETERIRHSKEIRRNVMFLKHWVSTSVTPEGLSRM